MAGPTPHTLRRGLFAANIALVLLLVLTVWQLRASRAEADASIDASAAFAESERVRYMASRRSGLRWTPMSPVSDERLEATLLRYRGHRPTHWPLSGRLPPKPEDGIRVDPPPPRGPEDLGATGQVHLRAWKNGAHTLHRASGKTGKVEVADLPEALPLDGAWKVSFPPDRGVVDEAVFNPLVAWNQHPDPGIRHFSGTATYERRFELPKDFLADGREVWLDLGEVEVMAEVRLNGEDLGVLWHPPFRVELGKVLKPGANTLEVEVTNLWVNRLIGDEQHPDDCEWEEGALARWPEWFTEGKPRPSKERVTFTTWKHWTADDPLLPSGLIGPVTLRSARLVPLP